MNKIGAQAVPAVTAADVKPSVGLLIDETDHDANFEALILSATSVVEAACATTFIAADFQFDVPACAWDCWYFPIRPVVSLVSIEARDAAGDWVSVDTDGVLVLAGQEEPRLKATQALRDVISASVEVRATASCGGAAQEQMRRAVILMVKEWWDAGLSEDAGKRADLSFGVLRLINQVRYRRPMVTM